MQRKPWFTFDNTLDVGVDKIPLNSNVHIIDAGVGLPKFISVIDIAGLGAATTVTDLLALTAQWVEISKEEVGGILYSATTNYVAGDVVTDGGAPQKIWIALQPTLNNPPLAGANWQAINSKAHTSTVAATYDPTGDVYPLTVGETVGAISYVQGLGRDANNDKIGYTYLAGDLTGLTVYDEDKVTWVDGPQGTEIWLHISAASIRGEIGGIAWVTGRSYLVGDVVSDSVANDLYVCIVDDPASASTPSTPNASWKAVGGGGAEVGGIAWVAATSYVVGDVVSDVEGVYTCILAAPTTTASPATPNTTNWKRIDVHLAVDNFMSAAGQTNFALVYNINAVEVYANGLKVNANEYTATDGANIVMNEPQALETWIHVRTNLDAPAATTTWGAVTGTPTTVAGYGITDAASVAYVDAKTWTWSRITATPTTLAGYGITDGVSQAYVDAKTWDWATDITGAPTTLAGYGITDAYPTGVTLDLAGQSIDNAVTVVFNGLYDNGAGVAIDAMNGQYQVTTLSANGTLSLVAPAGPCTVYLHIYQDGTGGRTLAWPAGGWVAKTPKVVTAAASAHDLMMIHYDGTGYTFDLMQDIG